MDKKIVIKIKFSLKASNRFRISPDYNEAYSLMAHKKLSFPPITNKLSAETFSAHAQKRRGSKGLNIVLI